jgi:hypothetical protein
MATFEDYPAVARLGMEALRADPIKGQRPSWEKVDKLAQEVVVDPNNYSAVYEHEGEIVGAVSVLVHPAMVFERHQASVVQFYCKKQGKGIWLLKHFLKWARAQRKIKSIVFTLETGADERIGKLLERLGLSSEMPVFVEWR